MKTYPIHPAAAKLPLLTGDAREELKRALHDRGQLEPIKLHNLKGKPHVLDGRNRQELLLELKVQPKYISADLRGRTPEQYVVDMNLERRHLTPSQKGAYALKLMPELKKLAKVRQVEAGKKKKKPAGASSAAKVAAKTMKVSTRTVERAIAIAKKAPELLPAIEAGKTTLKQAEKKIRNAEQVQLVKKYVPPEGRFNVVTVDFSWEYDDKLDGSDAVRGGLPYPPMKVHEILDFIRGPLKRACDETACLLGNWITGPMSLDLRVAPLVQRAIEELGFRPLHERIWKKTRASGEQFVGLGRPVRWDAEKLQLYVRGDVVFNELGEAHGRPIQQTVFEAPVGEHSEKPQKAYDDLEQLVPYTSRLEMFSRAARKGWVTSGAEMPDAAPAPVGSAPTSSAAQVDGALVRSPPADQGTPPVKGGALSKGKGGRRKTPPLSEQFAKPPKAKPSGPERWICPECSAEDETGEAGFKAHMATHAPAQAPDVTPPERPKALEHALPPGSPIDPKVFEQPAPVATAKLYEYGSDAAPAAPKLPLDGLVDGTLDLGGNFEMKPHLPELAPLPSLADVRDVPAPGADGSWEYAHAEGGKLAAEAAEKPAEPYTPPVDPASTKPVPDDEIPF